VEELEELTYLEEWKSGRAYLSGVEEWKSWKVRKVRKSGRAGRV